MVYDCTGACVAQTAVDTGLTNASCDDYGELDLDCSVFSFDNGDCRPVNTPNTSCGTDLVYDCADNCVDEVAGCKSPMLSWVSNGTGLGLCH